MTVRSLPSLCILVRAICKPLLFSPHGNPGSNCSLVTVALCAGGCNRLDLGGAGSVCTIKLVFPCSGDGRSRPSDAPTPSMERHNIRRGARVCDDTHESCWLVAAPNGLSPGIANQVSRPSTLYQYGIGGAAYLEVFLPRWQQVVAARRTLARRAPTR